MVIFSNYICSQILMKITLDTVMFLFIKPSSFLTFKQSSSLSKANYIIFWQKAEHKNWSNRFYIRYTLYFLLRIRIVSIPNSKIFHDFDDSSIKKIILYVPKWSTINLVSLHSFGDLNWQIEKLLSGSIWKLRQFTWTCLYSSMMNSILEASLQQMDSSCIKEYW